MISERLKRIILCQLKLNNFDLTDQMQAYQVPGWDSLNHIIILAAVEKEYGIHFEIVEVLRLKNLGDLQNLVNSKIADDSKL
jgi:acyl carrier protein